MSARTGSSDAADRVADRLKKVPGPWDVYVQRARRYEIHLNGPQIEMVRGPIEVEGYGLRLLRYREGKTGTGFVSSTDLSAGGVEDAARTAESLCAYSSFPAAKVDLPHQPGAMPEVEVVDRRLWERPSETLEEHVRILLDAFDGKRDVTPSFGSVRAVLSETTIANSEGLATSFPDTTVEFEIAVKAHGGPEGAPPGEYWVNETSRRLQPERIPAEVEEWCRFARDVRRAAPTPSGELPVVLPGPIVGQILPSVLGLRLTGTARLRELAPPIGTRWGTESLTVYDDGLVPWATASSPVDVEGTPQRRTPLLKGGAVAGLLYDCLHAAAFGATSTGSATRGARPAGGQDWCRFIHPPEGASTTLVVEPGAGGRDEELVEAAQDGLWVQQLGWAVPDPFSGAFGGEVRIGYRIRNGKLAEPVRGGTVGGVVMAPEGQPSMLAGISAIGSHAALFETISSPALLIRSLTVAGTTPPG